MKFITFTINCNTIVVFEKASNTRACASPSVFANFGVCVAVGVRERRRVRRRRRSRTSAMHDDRGPMATTSHSRAGTVRRRTERNGKRSRSIRLSRATMSRVLALALACACAIAHAAAGVTVYLAQSHVLPAPARTFTGYGLASGMDDLTLHLVGNRAVFVIVEFATTPTNPELSVYNDAHPTPTTIQLKPPSDLPPTYGDADPNSVLDGVPFSTTAYSANVSKTLISKGLHISVVSAGSVIHTISDIVVGAPTDWELYTLPMYYYGASPDMTGTPPTGNGTAPVTLTPEVVGIMPEANRRELSQRMPVASFTTHLHPGRYIKSDCIIISPRGSPSAYRSCSVTDERDGFASLAGGGMKLLAVMMELDGRKPFCEHVYAPLVMLTPEGGQTSGGGGLGGQKRGAGNRDYRGTFLHEQIHGFEFLDHAKTMYNGAGSWIPIIGSGEYSGQRFFPYAEGSANESVWAYDGELGYFYDTYAKGDACTSDSPNLRVTTDPVGAQRCYKQDMMQSGSGDKEDGLNFGFITDFTAAFIQRWFEGFDTSTTGPAWQAFTLRSRGCVHKGKGPSGGHGMWNVTSQAFDDFEPDAIDLPHHLNEQMTAAYITVNCAELQCDASGKHLNPPSNRSATTYIYPPMSYVGQMREIAHVDDDVQFERFHHTSATRDGRWERQYSHNGCDFIVTFHFANGVRNRTLVPWASDGFRAPGNPRSAIQPDATIFSDGDSLIEMGVGTLGDDPIRVDLEYLPETCLLGAHSRQPQLLTSWVKTSGEEFGPSLPQDDRWYSMYLDFKMSVPFGYDHCSVGRTFGFVRAIEKAAFKAIGGNVGGAAAGVTPALPALTSVLLKCICSESVCPENCQQSFNRPIPDVPRLANPTHAQPSQTAVPWSPVCGCNFRNYNDATQLCQVSGTFHQSTLTRVNSSISGVYYYENADGVAMRIDSDYFEEIEPRPARQPLADQVAACRSTPGCIAFDYAPETGKAKLMSGCAEPCYEIDTSYGRSTYYVDQVNPWSVPPADRPQSDSLTFRIEFIIPGHAPALDISETISRSSTMTSLANTVVADVDFYAQIPWNNALSASSIILVGVTEPVEITSGGPSATSVPDVPSTPSEPTVNDREFTGVLIGVLVGGSVTATAVVLFVRRGIWKTVNASLSSLLEGTGREAEVVKRRVKGKRLFLENVRRLAHDTAGRLGNFGTK